MAVVWLHGLGLDQRIDIKPTEDITTNSTDTPNHTYPTGQRTTTHTPFTFSCTLYFSSVSIPAMHH